ncbi:MAG: TRAP transporter small permease [Lachnotalea sp.]
MNKVRNVVNKIVEFMSCSILALMTILVTWQVITRFVFSSPSTITEALAKYLFIWLVLVTAAYVVGKREHMAIEFFVGRFPKKTQNILGLVSEVIIILFAAVVLTYGGGYIAMNAMSQTDSALPIPVGVVYMALPVGGILTVFYAVCNFFDLVKSVIGLDTKEVEETV